MKRRENLTSCFILNSLPTFAFALYLGSWYLALIKNHLCSLRNVHNETNYMCNQTAHVVCKSEFFSSKLLFRKLKVCASCVHILCHTIHFWVGRMDIVNIHKGHHGYISDQKSSERGVQNLRFRRFWPLKRSNF